MTASIKSALWAWIRRRVAASPAWRARLEFALENERTPFFPPGHFYSPEVDPVAACADAVRLWPTHAPALPGIVLDADAHARFIDDALTPRLAAFAHLLSRQGTDDPLRYPSDNDQFGPIDAFVLFDRMLHHAPRRIVEVGSGYSTLLMRAVNLDHFDGRIAIDCVEPYPREFLRHPDIGATLHTLPVQSTPVELFSTLAADDILFIDSSHVAKTGSDVNHLFFDILPRLAEGVIVHVHDIFLPFEYPRAWVIDGRRSWNEQYLLRALLMDSQRYSVLFGVTHAMHLFADRFEQIASTLALSDRSGSSFWIQVERA